MTDEGLPPDRLVMLRLLEAARAECRASSHRRAWSAAVGLAGGLSVEIEDVGLESLPAVVLAARRDRAIVYTTLRDIVFVETRGRDAPALPLDASAGGWLEDEEAEQGVERSAR